MPEAIQLLGLRDTPHTLLLRMKVSLFVCYINVTFDVKGMKP